MLPQTILAVASGVLGVLALVLAATGLYGVLAFQLQRRVREIGVRKALGAPSARVLRGVLGRSLAWLAIGGGVGLLLGQVLALALGDLLFGIRGYDLAALAGVAVAFLLMVAVASALPLRRALLLQPSEALRHD
jgi:ABC-type antimicrobial peptide transport system permease subunit